MSPTKTHNFFYFLVGTIIILIPALSNNYPFVYSDTGTYIVSGFDNYVPKDRPIFYGWFIRHLSLSLTFWLPVIVQAFFTFTLIHITVKNYLISPNKKPIALVISLLLVTCTGVGLFAGKLMPDIFTGLVILAGFLLFSCRSLLVWEKIILSLVFYFGLMVHLSNLIMIILFLIVFVVYHFFGFRFQWRKIWDKLLSKKLFISLGLLSILTVPTVNVIMYDKFQFSASSHVFLMARMGESGILKRYLDTNCEDGNYKLCAYKNEIPSSATTFIWPPESILYKTGGWDSTKMEYREILGEIYSTPKYWKWLITDFTMATFRQFFTFSPGVIAPHLKFTAPYDCMIWKMPHELNIYLTSKQQQNDFPIDDIVRRQLILVYCSLAVIFFILFSGMLFDKYNTFSNKGILFILLFMLLNAFVCGALANVLDRLQGRVIWILPLVAIILVLNYFSDKKLLQSHSK